MMPIILHLRDLAWLEGGKVYREIKERLTASGALEKSQQLNQNKSSTASAATCRNPRENFFRFFDFNSPFQFHFRANLIAKSIGKQFKALKFVRLTELADLMRPTAASSHCSPYSVFESSACESPQLVSACWHPNHCHCFYASHSSWLASRNRPGRLSSCYWWACLRASKPLSWSFVFHSPWRLCLRLVASPYWH